MYSFSVERLDINVDHDQEKGIASVVLLVFVLSAVAPSRVGRFLKQVYETTKPGGNVCFRDYGKPARVRIHRAFEPAHVAYCLQVSMT